MDNQIHIPLDLPDIRIMYLVASMGNPEEPIFVNPREVQNLELLQLKAKPSPFLCHVALPSYSSYQPEVNPNRDCDRIPQLLSDRYHISLEEAQEIVNEARQHRWD